MKDDKKKVIVLGVLFAVLAGVGAFTMLGGSSPAPTTTTTASKSGSSDADKDKLTKDEEEGPKNPLYAADLTQRDPFQPGTIPGDPTAATPKSTTQVSLPTPPKGRRSARVSGGGYESIPPVQITGQLPSGNIGLTPTGPDPSTFNYSVSGVIVGQRPAAVFTDAQGNQRLVPVGGSLDGDSKVISIDKGQVTVEHRGKKLRLPLGGNPK